MIVVGYCYYLVNPDYYYYGCENIEFIYCYYSGNPGYYVIFDLDYGCENIDYCYYSGNPGYYVIFDLDYY